MRSSQATADATCPAARRRRRIPPVRGLTVRDVAARLRVGTSKVRGWIERGELHALNTADLACGRPRWVITPEALAEFEQRLTTQPTPKQPSRRRQRKPAGWVSYYSEAS